MTECAYATQSVHGRQLRTITAPNVAEPEEPRQNPDEDDLPYDVIGPDTDPVDDLVV